MNLRRFTDRLTKKHFDSQSSRGQVAEIRLASPPIVENLDVSKQALAGLVARSVILMAHRFIFNVPKKLSATALSRHSSFRFILHS